MNTSKRTLRVAATLAAGLAVALLPTACDAAMTGHGGGFHGGMGLHGPAAPGSTVVAPPQTAE
jgi:hypothetical protein